MDLATRDEQPIMGKQKRDLSFILKGREDIQKSFLCPMSSRMLGNEGWVYKASLNCNRTRRKHEAYRQCLLSICAINMWFGIRKQKIREDFGQGGSLNFTIWELS